MLRHLVPDLRLFERSTTEGAEIVVGTTKVDPTIEVAGSEKLDRLIVYHWCYAP